MNTIQLQKKLDIEGVSRNAYVLNSDNANEQYCLNKTEKYWEVYYSERGSKNCLRVFKTEEEACDYLYYFLMTDESVIKNTSLKN